MIDIYEFFDNCRENGLDGDEAMDEFQKAKAMEHAKFIEEYENNPLIHEGWRQQDMIDMRRRER